MIDQDHSAAAAGSIHLLKAAGERPISVLVALEEKNH